MDHLKPLPDGLLQQLEEYCIPFREEFYECRIDGGGRHDPISNPFTKLTMNAATMAVGNASCREWQQVERLLKTVNQIRNPLAMDLHDDLIGGLADNPTVLRPRATGKSLSTRALLETMAKLSVPIFIQPPRRSNVFSDYFDRVDRRFRTVFEERPMCWPDRKTYLRTDTPNTTDYPLPRGGKRIPKHGEMECKPSTAVLALIARSQK